MEKPNFASETPPNSRRLPEPLHEILLGRPKAAVIRHFVLIQCEPVCAGTYDIDLSDCQTPLELVGWIHHLGDKVWFSHEHARDLCAVVAAHFGWGLRP